MTDTQLSWLDLVREKINDVISKLETERDVLQEEQDVSESEHADWDEESGDEEPEEISNEDEIGKLARAVSLLESALDELK